MSLMDNLKGVQKRTTTLFYIIDASFSMEGKKIGEVNYAIQESIPEIRKVAEESADANIKVAVLIFSSGARWLYREPIDIADFTWKDISVDGMTDFGCAMKELNSKLKRSNGGFMAETSGTLAPAFLLMSDGMPTDSYEKYLDELYENGWFKHGSKMAIAIGDDAEEDMLYKFTKNKEAITKVHNPETLAKVIKFLSVTSAQIQTKSYSKMDVNDDSISEIDIEVPVVPDEILVGDSEYDDWD